MTLPTPRSPVDAGDGALVRRLGRGDGTALAELYDRYGAVPTAAFAISAEPGPQRPASPAALVGLGRTKTRA